MENNNPASSSATGPPGADPNNVNGGSNPAPVPAEQATLAAASQPMTNPDAAAPQPQTLATAPPVAQQATSLPTESLPPQASVPAPTPTGVTGAPPMASTAGAPAVAAPSIVSQTQQAPLVSAPPASAPAVSTETASPAPPTSLGGAYAAMVGRQLGTMGQQTAPSLLQQTGAAGAAPFATSTTPAPAATMASPQPMITEPVPAASAPPPAVAPTQPVAAPTMSVAPAVASAPTTMMATSAVPAVQQPQAVSVPVTQHNPTMLAAATTLGEQSYAAPTSMGGIVTADTQKEKVTGQIANGGVVQPGAAPATLHAPPAPQQQVPMQAPPMGQQQPSKVHAQTLPVPGATQAPPPMQQPAPAQAAPQQGMVGLAAAPPQQGPPPAYGAHPNQHVAQQQPPQHAAPPAGYGGFPPQQAAPMAHPPVAVQAPPPGNMVHAAPAPHPEAQHQPPPAPPAAGQQQPPADPGMRELRVEDALFYLDDVKREFKDRPRIYNEFLAIMKNFKSQEVDTTGVIARVSKLFRGYNKLILGFNTFLPDGYKISLHDLKRQEREHALEEQRAAVQKKQQEWQEQHQQPPPAPLPSRQEQQHHAPPYAAAPPPAVAARKPPPRPPKPAAAPQQQQGVDHAISHAKQHQAVEFDHAISYVTTIKRRFANDPGIYHQFLEILHTYQKEQKGIKEVLEQVAHLFQDHPDLLKEFTFFLPDAVQEQAKERLHRAAADSEARLASQRQQQLHHYGQRGPPGQKFIDMTGQQGRRMDIGGARKRKLDGQPVLVAAQQPESYVYNSAVERQFFDATREALTSYTRDGGQAWAEFVKCLDMYAQDILSRSEMLNFVEPLLGKRNTKLFEEFKRMLAAAGTPMGPALAMEDSWHSVPLSEIDFSRCRRCTPSYRALPRDYPAPPCSDRSDEEAKVLNDIWVSLPVGSEESYTFRHMRRNTYEETLFRVEDERFEIDMVIDSNAATLQRLEPIAREIAQLAQEELVPADLGSKPPAEGSGMGGRRFQYTFDKNILGVIHRNTIARIYGDMGQEMLELMVKNPTVAIPVVVQRLRQKDVEFQAVRERLNLHWKELAASNYYRSLDHRGLTWRTIDKKGTSSRTLITEIKDRAVNGGREGAEALRLKLDKAKEEHGTFYEVTMGEQLAKDLDLTFLPKPDRRVFTPHLALQYTGNSWAQRDAYRILSFALERGSISPADKERCHRMWMEFLGPWFGLSLNWMQRPAVTYQESTAASKRIPLIPASVVSEEDNDDDSAEGANIVVTEDLRENEAKDVAQEVAEFVDHHPLPAGAHVSTLYGEGLILEFRRSDHIYVVKLGFGATGYIRPASVLCSLLPVEKTAYTRELRSHDRSRLARPGDQMVVGPQSLYLFLRLHQILVHRLNIAKRLAYSVGDDQSLQTMVEQMDGSSPNAVGRARYEAYLSLVYALLDGGIGGAADAKYEDRLRSLLGHGAYELATMDKLISHIWKNLQSMAQDETMWNLVQIYRRHLDAGSFQPEAFRQEAAYSSDGEVMYAFQLCPVAGKDESVLYMEHLGVIDDSSDDQEMAQETEEPQPVEDTAPSNKRQRR